MNKKKIYFICFFIIFLIINFVFADNNNQETVKWFFEDPSPENGWDYCFTWQGDGDQIGIVGEYKNVMVSTEEFHSGKTSLLLEIDHLERGFCGVWLTTGAGNLGQPATSWDEVNAGHDISACDTMVFWIKGVGKAKIKNIQIELQDTKDRKTDKLHLVDYIKADKKWRKVQIPLNEFAWDDEFNKKKLKAIVFLVESSDPAGKYNLYIDDFKFIKKGRKLKKRFKLIFDDKTTDDKAWNYSGSWEGNGSTVIKTSHHDNMPISLKEKYKGFTSFQFSFKQKKEGWVGCYLTGSRKGTGTPPESMEDCNKPIDISVYNNIRFWIKGKKKVHARMALGDVNNNLSKKIELSKYVSAKNKWQEVLISYKDISWQSFDPKQFKEIKLIVDADHPKGEFTVYIDNFEFIE